MMSKLIMKEFKLAVHPTSYIFLALSLMLLIPNYPYYVTFFYTGLGIFFTCLTGRENQDIFYSGLLPVRKIDIVNARITSAIILELLQMLIAFPVAWIRQSMNMPGNQVGMDANIAFFGLALIEIGLFNIIFFTKYYKNINKVGNAFVLSSIVVFLYMGVMETLTHVVPFFKDKLDTKDPEFLGAKIAVFAIGMVVFVVLNAITYKKCQKSFEKIDL